MTKVAAATVTEVAAATVTEVAAELTEVAEVAVTEVAAAVTTLTTGSRGVGDSSTKSATAPASEPAKQPHGRSSPTASTAALRGETGLRDAATTTWMPTCGPREVADKSAEAVAAAAGRSTSNPARRAAVAMLVAVAAVACGLLVATAVTARCPVGESRDYPPIQRDLLRVVGSATEMAARMGTTVTGQAAQTGSVAAGHAAADGVGGVGTDGGGGECGGVGTDGGSGECGGVGTDGGARDG